ncbi:hypothetical protein [Nocardiopsis deserti]|uniref:hypothetical protein n=1 Tax=Nocardiopsis deserti TaxID=2605988 RepID=UPI00123946A4
MSPRREKLTSPQTRIALARGNRPAQHLLPIPEPVDTEAARALFRAQRRTAVRTVAVLSALLFGMSGAFALFPGLGEIRPGGVPLSWLLLTVAIYPMLFGLALWHVRSAERIEDRAESAADRAGAAGAPERGGSGGGGRGGPDGGEHSRGQRDRGRHGREPGRTRGPGRASDGDAGRTW